MLSDLPISLELLEKNNNVNLNTPTILLKSPISDAWLGPECSSTGGFSTLFKVQAQRYLAASMDVIILKFKSANSLYISQPLKQLHIKSICAMWL